MSAFSNETIAARISWAMFLRVVIISVLLGMTIFLNRNVVDLTAQSSRFLFALIIITYFFTIIYAAWYKTGVRLRLLANFQFVVDSLLFSGIVYVTGGPFSGFTFMYHLWVIVAAIVNGRNASYFQAVISSMLFLALSILMSAGILSPIGAVTDDLEMGPNIAYFILVNVFSMFLVAALVNVLLRRLEQADASLARALEGKEALEAQLKQRERLAALGEFAATLAHEIRNPLSAVSGSFQMIRSTGDCDAEDLVLYDIIERELDRIGRLVEDILVFTRPRQAVLEEIDVSRTLSEVVQLFTNAKAQMNVTFVPADNVRCNADVEQFTQVAWNILVNAAQAAGETGRIEVSLVKDDGWFHFTVSDSGPGVCEDNIDKIFNPFFTTKERGIGLGLALCQRIVSEHGGRISIENSELGGAAFVIRLPLAEHTGSASRQEPEDE